MEGTEWSTTTGPQVIPYSTTLSEVIKKALSGTLWTQKMIKQKLPPTSTGLPIKEK
jgi:hypothetical protein